MKKLYTLIIASLTTSLSFSQVPWATYGEWVENGSFECWENEDTPQMEPCNWSSLKTSTPSNLADAAPDGSVTRDAGRNGGYCIKLYSQAYTIGAATIVANGLATTGRVYASFDPEEGYVFTSDVSDEWNMPQVHRPDSIMGYFKFAPQGGDKGKIEAIIHTSDDPDGNTGNGIAQLPPQQSTSNYIARARVDFTTSQSTWKRFSAPFNYSDPNAQPAYMLITCAAGDSTLAVDGTTLWMDDIEEVYNTLSIEEKNNEFLDFSLVNGNELLINYNNIQNYNIAIYSLDGKELLVKENCTDNQFVIPNYISNGFFVVKLSSEKSFHTKKYFIK